ncbi:MAG TPA: molybdenum ABC transporter ATP-binding protein [Steroidobacteraceae bacterium]|nr:molybdenum ABC transporter ATP-binding protein [Steroidobacteraceae bacterium]
MTLKVALAKRLGSFLLDVDFELPTPGVAALFGPSGCGKSTTINIIAGLLAADRGEVALDGTVLLDSRRQIDIAAERRRIGYVFQDARLFPHLSVAGNLGYAQRRARAAPYVSLDQVIGLLDIAPLTRRRVHQLSGGERQRVAIARALLSQPRLLLLDEPLAALDWARREEILPYLETLRDRLSIPMIYVSHQFSEVSRLATHIVLMQAGRVVEQGDIGRMSVSPKLRAMVGPEEIGAVIDGAVIDHDASSGLTRVRVGDGEIRVQSAGLGQGERLRVHLLARDVIVSTQPAQHLSVRNQLCGVVSAVDDDGASADLVSIDIGSGASILARVTKAATRELELRAGQRAWALIKSVSLRSHSFPRRARPLEHSR